MQNPWQDFVATQAQNFWEAFQTTIVNKLIDLIDKKLDLEKLIKEDNAKLLEEHKTMIAWLTEMSDEDKAEIKPAVVSFNDPFQKFQYAFNKLIEAWFTLLHDTDSHGNLNVKFFEKQEEFNFWLVGTYSVNLRIK